MPETDEHIGFICIDCVAEFPTPCEHIINGETYCNECESNLSRCVNCDQYILDSDFIDNDDGDRYCQNCYYERYTRCTGCSCELTSDQAYYHEEYDESYCESCYPRTHNCLYDYSYRPQPVYHRGRNESANNTTVSHNLYFGVELEIESEGNDIDYVVNRLSDFVYAKEDSSLSDEGFEVVSHPTTYQWLCENADQWLKILALRKDGFRSYNTSTCGMHVHLSKNYFGTLHLYKFLKFFYENPEFTLMISQRDEYSFNQWATLKTPNGEGSICYKARCKNGNYERHCAVNLQNKHTIEVRIFRGTLNPRSFWKNIEFLQALVEFTAQNSVDNISIRAFTVFVFNNKKRFINLHNWLHSKEIKELAVIE